MDRRILDALRLAREVGGGTVERKEWNPFPGLKIQPPAEELSKEPDIRDYQLARHAHEFEGGPEPTAPTRKVTLNAPLLGGKKELGELPYYLAKPANTAVNALYGLKTAPLYASEVGAPVARAIDAYETAQKIEEDPSSVSSYTKVPKLFMGATPLGLAAGAAGAASSVAEDKDDDEEGKTGMRYGGEINDALRLARHQLRTGGTRASRSSRPVAAPPVAAQPVAAQPVAAQPVAAQNDPLTNLLDSVTGQTTPPPAPPPAQPAAPTRSQDPLTKFLDYAVGNIEKSVADAVAAAMGSGLTPQQALINAMDEMGITDPAVRNAMAANVQVETSWQNKPEVSYRTTSNARIRSLFSNARGLSDAELDRMKADDRLFFNMVFGNKNGNRPGTDDGYR